MTKDEEASRYMMIVEQCKEQLNQLEMQSQYIQAAIMDYNKARLTIEQLKKLEKETEMMIPIGGGAFINTTAKKQEKILIEVGAGIVIEKTYDDAIKKIDERIQNIEKSQARLDEMMQNIQKQGENAAEKAQNLIYEEK
ncbi:MAG: prefoldin subunit alpha [Candidatus Thermoplasmatota archaeon]|nr:prefoldin subunit alpha [Candidatus Thermoplasmatota archaeon]